MTDAADDFEALFEEVSAQRTEPVGTEAAADQPTLQTEPQQQTGGEQASEDVPLDQSGKPMYERLGGIVRLLHDSLRELGYDRSLNAVANQINDAQDRLSHIASLTEQAAVKVLNAVDHGMPEQDTLAKKAQEMDDRWTQLFDGKLSVEEFKGLAGDSKQFASIVTAATEAEKARLLDIMMAQDFQDITGQLIKKIIGITNTVELELAQLLKDNAPPEVKAALENKPEELMQGPSTPANAMAQDDVDSLLADLGF